MTLGGPDCGTGLSTPAAVNTGAIGEVITRSHRASLYTDVSHSKDSRSVRGNRASGAQIGQQGCIWTRKERVFIKNTKVGQRRRTKYSIIFTL